MQSGHFWTQSAMFFSTSLPELSVRLRGSISNESCFYAVPKLQSDISQGQRNKRGNQLPTLLTLFFPLMQVSKQYHDLVDQPVSL